MKKYLPEGSLLKTQENLALTSSLDGLQKAFEEELILEGIAHVCDIHHNLILDLNGIKGIIPREDCALGIKEGTVRDIAIISRVNKPVAFQVMGFTEEGGETIAILSRKAAQIRCQEEYIYQLSPGDIIPAKVTHLDTFGAFVDIGLGVISLIPIDLISVSRISHPRDRFAIGDAIHCIVKGFAEDGKVCLTHRELLGTWEENVKHFQVGETVKGIIRSTEDYGVFVELLPNLAGLAEFYPQGKIGQTATVYIKNIIPEKMKIKLVIIHTSDEVDIQPCSYYLTEGNLSTWSYSPPHSQKVITTDFSS